MEVEQQKTRTDLSDPGDPGSRQAKLRPGSPVVADKVRSGRHPVDLQRDLHPARPARPAADPCGVRPDGAAAAQGPALRRCWPPPRPSSSRPPLSASCWRLRASSSTSRPRRSPRSACSGAWSRTCSRSPGVRSAPGLSVIGRLYRPLAGYGLTLVAVAVVGALIAGPLAALGFLVGTLVGGLINMLVDFLLMRRPAAPMKQPLSSTERFFLHALRQHARCLGPAPGPGASARPRRRRDRGAKRSPTMPPSTRSGRGRAMPGTSREPPR